MKEGKKEESISRKIYLVSEAWTMFHVTWRQQVSSANYIAILAQCSGIGERLSNASG